MVNLVHEFEIVVGLHAVFGHHPPHGGAIAEIIVLLHTKRRVGRYFQKIGDVGANTLVHLLPEIEVMRIERVVEIEHPGFDVAEAARRFFPGEGQLLFLEADGRCRLFAHIDDGKTGGIQTASRAVLMVGKFEAAVART